MDGQQFDTLAKALGRAVLESRSRRGALGTALALLGLAASETVSSAASHPRKSGRGETARGEKRRRGGKRGKGRRRKKHHHSPLVGPPPPCVPSCAGKQCGGDGCGGTCGSCTILGDVCQGGRCVATTCGVGEKICPPGNDAHCCVAGQNCCPPHTGVNGCCGVDLVCCPNKAACCPNDFPECCAGTRFCCKGGDQCCSAAAGAGCCPGTAPHCCPPGLGNDGFCCDSAHPVCARDATRPAGYCCPPNSVGDGNGGCVTTGNQVQAAGMVLHAAGKTSRARSATHDGAGVDR